jgi:hypothetical protein
MSVCVDVDWFHLAENKVHCSTCMNAVMKSQFRKSLQICGLCELLAASQYSAQTVTPTLSGQPLRHRSAQTTSPTPKFTDSHSDTQCTATPTPKCTASHTDTEVHNQSDTEVHRQPPRHSVHSHSDAAVHRQSLRRRNAHTATTFPFCSSCRVSYVLRPSGLQPRVN